MSRRGYGTTGMPAARGSETGQPSAAHNPFSSHVQDVGAWTPAAIDYRSNRIARQGVRDRPVWTGILIAGSVAVPAQVDGRFRMRVTSIDKCHGTRPELSIIRRPFGVPRAIFSFEALFALFLFAGVFKNDPRLAWIPVDLTLLLLVGTVVYAAPIIAARQGRATEGTYAFLALFAVFLIYATASLTWTPGRDYARAKAAYLWAVVFWPMLVSSIIIADDSRRLSRFLGVMAVMSLALGILIVIIFVRDRSSTFIRVLGGQYLGAGRMLGVGALLFYFRVMFGRTRRTVAANLVVFLVLAALQLVVGGRGPLIALILSLPIPFAFGVRVEKNDIRLRRFALAVLAVLLVVGAALVYLVAANPDLFTLRRILLLFSNDIGESASTRLTHYARAFAAWKEHPLFGWGLGSYPIIIGTADVKAHPHNLVLEVLCELGLVGLALLAIAAVGSLRWGVRIIRITGSEHAIEIVTLLVFGVLNAMISNDITENRLVWVFLALLLQRPRRGIDASILPEHVGRFDARPPALR